MNGNGRDEISIETDAGRLRAWRADGGEISVDMGQVATGWRDVPLAHEVDTRAVPLGIDGLGDAVCHSMGNPHAVVFVDDAEAVDLARLGPLAEHAALFPQRVNLSVVSRIGEASFECGLGARCRHYHGLRSGACAVGVAVVRRGLGPRSNRIVMDGGAVGIDWDPDSRHVVMTGPVAYVCDGVLSAEFDRMLG